MGIVQNDEFRTECVAGRLENARYVTQVRACIPGLYFGRCATSRRLVFFAALSGHSVRRGNTWDGRLQPDGPITVLAMLCHGIQQFRNVPPGRVGVDQTAGAASSTQELIDGQASCLAFDVHNAMSTAAIAAIVTGPPRQYAPRYR